MGPSSCYETELLKSENENLSVQNKELRKKLDLLQENVNLRNTLEHSGHNVKQTQLHGIPPKPKSHDSRNSKDGSMPSRDGSKNQIFTPDSAKNQATPDKNKEYVTHSPQNSHQLHLMQHIIGEIAFQLDRRILAYIFPDHGRLYGVTVSNIPKKITEVCTERGSGTLDGKKQAEMMQRYEEILNFVKQYGYDLTIHPIFTDNIVNLYAMKQYPPSNSPEMCSLCDPANLKKIVYTCVPSSDLDNINILLKCLSKLSRSDGKPVFLL